MPRPSQADTGSTQLIDRIITGADSFGARRDADDVWLTGVCSGLARRLNLDPAVIRTVMVVVTLFAGAGVIVYALAWFLMPAADGPSKLEKMVRSGAGPAAATAILVIAGIAVVTTILGNDGPPGFWPGRILLLAGVAGLVVYFVRGGRFENGRFQRGTVQGGSFRGGHGTPPPIPSGGHWHGQPTEAPTYAPGATADGPTPIPTGTAWPAPGPAGPQDAAYSPPPAHPGYQAATGYAPPAAPVAVPAATAVVPRRPKLRFWVAAFLAALTIPITVGVGLIHDAADWPGDATTIGRAVALAVVALVLIIAGLAGRRGGATSVLGFILAAMVATSAISSTGTFAGGIGERTWVASDSAQTFRLGMGEARLDLTDYDPSGQAPTISASVGVGELVVLVPEDATVRVDADVQVGGLEVQGEQLNDGEVGIASSRTFGSGEVDLVAEVDVLVGQVTIERVAQ